MGTINGPGLIILLLLIGIISVMRIPSEDTLKLRRSALEWSLAVFAATLVLWCTMDMGGQFQTIVPTQ